MSFDKRIQYASHIEYQEWAESRWDKRFGDRMNELVMIGQYPEVGKITFELTACLMTDRELDLVQKGAKIKDPWSFE